jgi:amidase
MGSTAMKSFVPSHDSELVTRFKRAGLIVLGKTNTCELGLLPTTEPALFGATRNPWDPARTPGGSSGGAAAAVAAHLVPLAHANDGGGSIRIPASACGLFGLKPTRGRNPLGPDVGDIMSGLVVEHAVTRSVRDSARLLDAIHGPDLGAPYTAPKPWRPYAEEAARDPRRLRIAFGSEAINGVPVDRACKVAVEGTAALLSELGHSVEEAAPSIDGARVTDAFIALWAAGTAADVEDFRRLGANVEEMEPFTRSLAEKGRQVSAVEYLAAVSYLQRMGRELARFLVTYDCWMTPTLAYPPPLLGSFVPTESDPLAPLHRASEFSPFTAIANASGQPAMSVPLHQTEERLPIGVHFLGRFGEEGALFALAGQLERARPWSYDDVSPQGVSEKDRVLS